MLNRYLAIDSESDKIASPTELLVVRLTEETSRKSQEHKLEKSISSLIDSRDIFFLNRAHLKTNENAWLFFVTDKHSRQKIYSHTFD